MKPLQRYISLALLALLAVVAGSCSKDAPVESGADKVNLTLHLSTRGDQPISSTDVNMKPEEGIRTLRVIITDEAGKVMINEKRDYSSEKPLATEKTLTIVGLTTGVRSFYIVVNEEGVNANFAKDFPVGSSFTANYQSKFVQASLLEPDVPNKGIPMAGELKNQTLVEGNVSFSIPVTRALARIDLTVNNKTGGNLSINEINFGAFFPVAGYLMKGQGGTVLNQAKDFTESQTIAKDGNHTFTYYLFESSGGTYTVGMKGSTNYDLAQISDKVTQQPIASIERNQILKIDANANATGWELACSVAPWIVNDSKIEFTDALTYTSYGWKQGTIAGRQDNVVELAQNVTAELTFLIQGPTGVQRWVAEVDDSENFELLTKEGAELFKDGTPVVQTIQVRVKEGANKDAVTKLHVYAVVAGSYSELDLTDAEGTSGVTHFELKIAGGQ